MRFNLGASPSPRHPTRRRSETVRNGPRSPGSGALGASAASRLASRRAANRRAAAVGSEGFAASSFASPNTKFDQTQTTASPKEEATFSGTPESPPPFDFSPREASTRPGDVAVRAPAPRGSPRRRRSRRIFLRRNLFLQIFLRQILPRSRQTQTRTRIRSLRTRLSRPTFRAERLSRPEPSRWARPRRRRPIDGRRPVGGKNGGRKSGKGKNGDEGTRARTARTFEFTPPPPPPGSGSSFTPAASAGSAPPPATMPDLNFAGFNLGAGSSSDKNKTSFRRNLRSDGTDRRRGGPARSSGPRRARGAPPSSSTKPGGESPGSESPPGESPGVTHQPLARRRRRPRRRGRQTPRITARTAGPRAAREGPRG